MGGIFGVVSKEDCSLDLFFGVDYHSHLGTRRGGLAVFNSENGFHRAIHNIQNSPFRTKFENDLPGMKGPVGIGCISDYEPQPLLARSHLGNIAITTVGVVTNKDELIKELMDNGRSFLEMSGGEVNQTELVLALLNTQKTILDGIKYIQSRVEGSMTLLIATPEGIYGARDKFGRTPLQIGKRDGAHCLSFESFAYINLGYKDEHELGPAEIVFVTPDSYQVLQEPGKEMKICTFLWIYYGYPTACYEGVNVEAMRYNCGKFLARRDKDANIHPDCAAGVPDSGTAHAVGYANEAGIPFTRPFIKYTPTWPRSFMPTNQEQRNLIAHMKLIPVQQLIKDKSILLIDDSIVRGTQLRETTDFLYESGAKEVHVRPACPPIMFGCKYLNFSRSKSEMDLIARRVVRQFEGDNVSAETLAKYCDPDTPEYEKMQEEIRKQLHFTTLRFHRLDDMLDSTGLDHCKLCTYCWNGKE